MVLRCALVSIEELALRFQHGDPEALGALWTGVERYARLVIRRYTPTAYADADDFCQCAFLGVREAALAYTGSGSLLRLIGWKVRRTCRMALGLPPFQRNVEACASLDAPVADDEDALCDLIPDDSLPAPTASIELEELRRDVRAAVDALPEPERLVIRAHWFDGLTLAQAGQLLDVTGERARQIEQAAFKHLRRTLRALYSPPPRGVLPTGLAAFRNNQASAVELEALARIEAERRERVREMARFLDEDVAAGVCTQELADEILKNFGKSQRT